ncbi:hypothetical protein [Streptomyces sp. 184]|uniref:hypothetical protein n=1 Tax=Streptomyces sp. 184 TaxID=1827526 RepID=UPI003891375B
MSLTVRGISYVTGETDADTVRADMRAIHDDLHCTTVMLIGTDVPAQAEAARIALDTGLDVYVRPYLPDRPRAELHRHLAATGAAAEELRAAHPGRVTLLVGSEFSLTQRGMLPGPRLFLRLQVLVRWRRFFDRRITRKLRPLLADALATARGVFDGPVTYAAGYWEDVDWTGFDVAGVNLYRMGSDPAAYERRLDALRREAAARGKPLVVTEFGCGAHAGAERSGPGGFRIVQWFAEKPRVREGHVRDEGTQAAYLTELIDLYAERGVHGCFVYTFAMRDFPHSPDDPRHDLDMAGFGVVRFAEGETKAWEKKEAYEAVAGRYGGIGGNRP